MSVSGAGEGAGGVRRDQDVSQVQQQQDQGDVSQAAQQQLQHSSSGNGGAGGVGSLRGRFESLAERGEGAKKLPPDDKRIMGGAGTDKATLRNHQKKKHTSDGKGYGAFCISWGANKRNLGRVKEQWQVAQFKKDNSIGADTDLNDHQLEQAKRIPIPPKVMGRLNERANEAAYREQFHVNENAGFYNCNAIWADLKQKLNVNDDIPSGIETVGNAMACVRQEIDKFVTSDAGGHVVPGISLAKPLTKGDAQKLNGLLNEVKDLYVKEYPDASAEDVYIFMRDMARNAIYQVMQDRRYLTGSDHGAKHILNNCKHAHSMFEGARDKTPTTPKQELLAKIVHFYHDIGYTVGEQDFGAKKDHPYTGGGFIESNLDYFEHFLGVDEAKMLQKAIQEHSIVCFDDEELAQMREEVSGEEVEGAIKRQLQEVAKELRAAGDFTMEIPMTMSDINEQKALIMNKLQDKGIVNDGNRQHYENQVTLYLKKLCVDQTMLRFVTSNSDACAVSGDEKAQQIWVRNPKLLKPIAKLRLFAIKFPQFAGVKGTLRADCYKSPEELKKAFPSIKDSVTVTNDNIKKLTADDFDDPLEFAAYKMYLNTVAECKKIIDDNKNISAHDKEAYKEAIDESLAEIGAKIVESQFAMILKEVGCEVNDGVMKPVVEMCSDLAGSLVGPLFTEGNIGKLAVDEYQASKQEVKEKVNDLRLKQEQIANLEKKDVSELNDEQKQTLAALKAEKHEIETDLAKIVISMAQPTRVQTPGMQEACQDIQNDFGTLCLPESLRQKLSAFDEFIKGSIKKAEDGDLLASYNDDLTEHVTGLYEGFQNLALELDDGLSPKQLELVTSVLTSSADTIDRPTADNSEVILSRLREIQLMATPKSEWEFMGLAQVEA